MYFYFIRLKRLKFINIKNIFYFLFHKVENMVGKWEMSQFWGFYTTIVLMVTPHSYFAIMNFNGKTQLQYYAISAGTTFARSIVRSLFLSVKPFLVRIKAALRGAKYGPRWSLCRVVGSGERSSL